LLVCFFEDDCKFPEAMYSIIHTIEMFDDKTYAREILKSLPVFWERSPKWAKRIHHAIFNSPSARQAYRSELRDAIPAVKAAARNLLSTMRETEPKFVTVCDEMLAVI